MIEFAGLDALELSEGYASSRFSPVEVTAALLQRIERMDPAINAFYQIDASGAMAMAVASEARWRSGAPLSRLDGVPTSIKDALPSKGDLSFRGSAAHFENVTASQIDAPVVARMREAGMVFLGKTTMPDFGILPGSVSSKHGVTRNPWNLDHSVGGSSSGAAASIAAGFNPVAIGTDIVGSIRLPAAFCGLFGFKPSQGRVPYYFPGSPSLVAGPMTRSVRDAAALMNIVAAPDDRDFTALPPNGVNYLDEIERRPQKRLRIAVLDSVGFGVEPSAEVIATFRASLKSIDLEMDLIDITAGFTADDLIYAETFYKARCYSEFIKFPAHMREQAVIINEWSKTMGQATANDFYEAFNRLQLLREKTVRLMDGFDFLLLPTVPRPAFKAEQAGYGPEDLFGPWINTFLFNLSEQPASSVPFGLTAHGLPVGVQIVGQRFDDVGVFQLSAILEKSFDWNAKLVRMIHSLQSLQG